MFGEKHHFLSYHHCVSVTVHTRLINMETSPRHFNLDRLNAFRFVSARHHISGGTRGYFLNSDRHNPFRFEITITTPQESKPFPSSTAKIRFVSQYIFSFSYFVPFFSVLLFPLYLNVVLFLPLFQYERNNPPPRPHKHLVSASGPVSHMRNTDSSRTFTILPHFYCSGKD